MDPVLTQLEERRRKARQLIARANAELDECDRFERFYRSVPKPDPAAAEFFGPPPQKPVDPSGGGIVGKIQRHLEQQSTLKKAIKAILANHPEGLLSGDLLEALKQSGYPHLLRTSMSPQLSRMKDKDVVNVDGRWTLIENKKAAGLF